MDENPHTQDRLGHNVAILHKEVELYKTIFDNIAEGIVIASLRTGFLVFANKSFCRLFNYIPGEIPGLHFTGLHPAHFMEMAGEAFGAPEKTLRNVPCLKKNNELFYADVSDSKITFMDEECKLATFVDVTERKNVEELLHRLNTELTETKNKLETEQEIFGQFLKLSPALIYFKDEKLRAKKLSGNFETLLGIPTQNMLGKINSELFPPEFARNMDADDLKVLKEHKTVEVQEEFNGKYYSTLKFPIELGDKTRYIAGFSFDITDKVLALKKLKDSEAKFRKLFEDDLTGDLIIDTNGIIKDCNASFLDIFGYSSKDEIIGQSIAVLHNSTNELQMILSSLNSHKQLRNYETIRTRKDGSLIHIIENITGDYDEKNELVQIKAYIFDINERKLAEQRQELYGKVLRILNRSHNLDSMVNDILAEIKQFTAFDSVGIRLKNGDDYPYYSHLGFSADFVSNGNFICSFCEKEGHIKHNIDGSPLLDCLCGSVISGTPVEGLPGFTIKGSFFINNFKAYSGILADKVPGFRPCCIDTGYQSLLLVPLRINNSIAGLLQLNSWHEGKIQPGFVAFFEEVSSAIEIAFARLEYRDKLEEAKSQAEMNEERWKFALEGANDGVWDWNLQTNEVFFSKQWKKMLGFEEWEIANNLGEWEKRVHPDDLQQCISDIQMHISGKWPVYSNIHRLLCKDGTFKWILDRGKIMKYSPDGKPLRMIGTHTDLTDRKKFENELLVAKEEAENREKQLQQLNVTKDKIFSIIAHDLRNPFNIILGYSELLNDIVDNCDAERAKRYVETISRSAQNTLSLLDNLLNWAKSQTGQINFNPQPLGLKPLLFEVFGIVNPMAQSKNISLSYSFPPELNVFADIDMLKTILRNLLSNALKFTPNEGKVAVSAKNTRDWVEISIADNGVGMEKNIIEKLFTLEKNAIRAGTSQEKGSGLGLLLCKEFVERHGGEIWVESAVGLGSNFKFTLPVKV
ncbi:MAG: PAS domain S-box protein [Bacteroidales bacterium]|nr:PAS domain S-box protein [Bacteroidales bacterium]